MAAPAWRVGMRVRVRGRRWRVDAVERGDDCTALRLFVLDGGSRPTLTLLAPFDRPAAIDRPASTAVVRPHRWRHEIDRALIAAHPFGGLTQVARARIRLLPYQLEPALALLRHGVARVLIADGVGLGKTIEAGLVIAELSAVSDSTRVLVLTPAGLREQWRQELEAHFALAGEVADSDWLRRTVAARPATINPWATPGIYIASHDFIKRPEVLRALEDVTWDLVVVDEAHAASSGTDRRAAIDRVACGAGRVMLLTATPPAGDPHEFTALCAIGLAGSGEGPPAIFARSVHDVGTGRQRRSRVLSVAPTAAEIAMHRELERYSERVWREAAARGDNRARLASIVLRKRALSSAAALLVSAGRRVDLLRGAIEPCASQLPLPFGDEDPLDDAEPVDALSAPGLDNTEREIRWLSAIVELARTAARDESKVRCLLRLLARVSEPIIVFTEYRDTLVRLERHIAASGRSVVVLHGGMDPRTRAGVPGALRAGAQTLVATDAAAEGLNLHHRCRVVVHFELPWNPARLEQRTGRVDRIGQRARVHEVALLSSTSAERLVLEPLARRAARARAGGAPGRMLATLTESRVTEAVMSGTPLALERESQDWHHNVVRLDLRSEAAIEAQRIETQRDLATRSPERRAASADPAKLWVTRVRPRDPEAGCSLLFAVGIEDGAGHCVHTEHLLVRVVWPRSPAIPNPAQLRRLASEHAHSARITALVDNYARATLSRVSRDAAAARIRIQQRSAAMERARASAAQQIVQLRMLAPPPTNSRDRVLAPALTTPEADFTVRWRLAGVIVRSRRG